jgi:GNAT superfamily N-acetyltransferase
VRQDHSPDLARFTVELPVRVRLGDRADLPALGGDGGLTHHREALAAAFERQARGDAVILVAEIGGQPAAHAAVDLALKEASGTGVLAVRVRPWIQGAGVAARLVDIAERVLAAKGYAAAEIGVEATDERARRRYERLGYRVVGRVRETYFHAAPGGAREEVGIEEWVLRKELEPAPADAFEGLETRQ